MENQIDEVLTLESRKKLSMTGVDSVDGFNDQFINLTVLGSKVKVSGEKLKVTSFNEGTGLLAVDGIVNEVKFCCKKVPFLKKIFK